MRSLVPSFVCRTVISSTALLLAPLLSGCTGDGSETGGGGGGEGAGGPSGPGAGPSTSNGPGATSGTASPSSGTTTSGGSTTTGGGPVTCIGDVENLTPAGDGGALINAFPACIGFATDAYASEYQLVWLNEGATHEYVPNGGWNGGGAARFTPPNPLQAATGLGQIHVGAGVTPPTHLSLRWLMKAGPTMGQYAHGNKTLIFVQSVNDMTHPRPMIITRPNPAVPNSFVPAPCDGTVCSYHGAPVDQPFWPNGNDTFWIGGDGGYQEQWVSWEFESDLTEGWIRLYITTQDGVFNDTMYVENALIDELSTTGGTFAYVDVLGGYFGDGVIPDPGNWFEIDEIVISDQHIGPPEGFVR
jgi:hypothetical protein